MIGRSTCSAQLQRSAPSHLLPPNSKNATLRTVPSPHLYFGQCGIRQSYFDINSSRHKYGDVLLAILCGVI